MRATLFLLSSVLLGTSPAWAGPEGLERAKARFEKEPKVAEVVDVALRYFRVHPEVMDELRSKSHTRAFLPLLATGFRFDDDRYARVETQRPDPNLNIDESTNTRQNAISVGAVWDLRELVFNPAEVQIYGRVVTVLRRL